MNGASRAVWWAGGCVVALTMQGGVLSGCSRHTQLRGDLPPFIGPERLVPPDSGIPTAVSSDELLGAPFLECTARDFGPCVDYSNDFQCAAYDFWVAGLATECQSSTGCGANGWVSFETNEEGCTARIGMTIPQEQFAACLRDAVGKKSCPCSKRTTNLFLGLGHNGCGNEGGAAQQPCGAAEFQCPAGFVCSGGLCKKPMAPNAGARDGGA